jgi:hypothetical protein
MHGTRLPKAIAAASLAVIALGAAQVARAGTGVPQRHPHRVGLPQKHPEIIGVLGRSQIIAILMRKSGGEKQPYT